MWRCQRLWYDLHGSVCAILHAGCWLLAMFSSCCTFNFVSVSIWCLVSPSSPPPYIRRHPEAAAVRRGGGTGGEYENVWFTNYAVTGSRWAACGAGWWSWRIAAISSIWTSRAGPWWLGDQPAIGWASVGCRLPRATLVSGSCPGPRSSDQTSDNVQVPDGQQARQLEVTLATTSLHILRPIGWVKQQIQYYTVFVKQAVCMQYGVDFFYLIGYANFSSSTPCPRVVSWWWRGPPQQGQQPRARAQDLRPRRLPQRQLPRAQLPPAAEQQQAQVRLPQVRLPEGPRRGEGHARPLAALQTSPERQIVSDPFCYLYPLFWCSCVFTDI